jgi:hypothetical protein
MNLRDLFAPRFLNDASDARTCHSDKQCMTKLKELLVPMAIAGSILGPFVSTFLVIDLIVGIENLNRHYWIFDGFILAAALNAIAFLPLLFRRVRVYLLTYAIVASILVSATSFVAYWIWMIALVGV